MGAPGSGQGMRAALWLAAAALGRAASGQEPEQAAQATANGAGEQSVMTEKAFELAAEAFSGAQDHASQAVHDLKNAMSVLTGSLRGDDAAFVRDVQELKASVQGLAAAWQASREVQQAQALPPRQAVYWTPSGEELVLDEGTAERWSLLRGPIGTVCVFGDDRIGKSTLLTLWASVLTEGAQPLAFETGHSHVSHTQGIWSATLPRELTGRQYHINLCDSQGAKQGTETQQVRLFSANVLLPSVLVYVVRDVLQGDQVVDLARMAGQFRRLSAEQLGRYGSLSPHLVVVRREDTELEGDMATQVEEFLAAPGFSDAKELVKSVFRTREYHVLRNLPTEAQRALKANNSATAHGGMGGPSAASWRFSGGEALALALAHMDAHREALPQGGPELVEWYRSVLQTVNSLDDGASLSRLVEHGELLAAWQERRAWLQEREPMVFAAVLLISLFACSGCLGNWLHWSAWITWVALCVCYAGASPLITAPLSGVAPRLCDSFVGPEASLAGLSLARSACREVSSHALALLVAACLGMFSYPLLAAWLRWLVRRMPMPGLLVRAGVTAGAGGAVCALWQLRQEDLGTQVGAERLHGPLETLMVSMIFSVSRVLLVNRRNRLNKAIGDEGRALHTYVAGRFPEVQALEASREWKAHYRKRARSDCIWQCRLQRSTSRLLTSSCLQAAAFMGWALMIYPRCDALLTAGVLINILNLMWAFCSMLRWCGSGRDPVKAWFNNLEDADTASAASDEEPPDESGSGLAAESAPEGEDLRASAAEVAQKSAAVEGSPAKEARTQAAPRKSRASTSRASTPPPPIGSGSGGGA